MGDMNQFMSIFMILIGVLTLYSAFTGKGPVYKNDYPKAMKKEANELLRKFCWILGPVVTASGILDYMGMEWAYWVGLGIIMPTLVVYFVIFRKRFKQYLNKK